MRWSVIAKHEAAESANGRAIRFLLGLLVLVCAFGGYLYPVLGQEPHTTAHATGFLTDWMAMLVPLVGIVIGYNAIVTERKSGALFLSLSLPFSRGDIVLGKFIGRMAVVSAGIVSGLLIAGGLVVYPFGELDLLPYLGFILLTVVLGAIYTGIGVAISMVAPSKQVATVGAFGVYFLFVLIWNELQQAVEFVLTSLDIGSGDLPGSADFILASEPGTVYDRLIAGFLDPSQSLEGAWYLGEWMALVLLVIWALLPLGIAYRRFAGVDL